jgi:hypothetical protein
MVFLLSVSGADVVYENGVDDGGDYWGGDEEESRCICCGVTFVFLLFDIQSVSLL